MLPMELWAHVASFLPFSELVPTFWALRRARMLPVTHTPPANALLQFCSEHTDAAVDTDAEERAVRHRTALRMLLVMGFHSHVAERVLALTDSHIEPALEYLVHHELA